MDLGINRRTAIVCGASAGLGYACAASLAEAGVNVFMAARDPTHLEAAAGALRERFPSTIATIASDVTTADGRAQISAQCLEPDILVNNAGGPVFA